MGDSRELNEEATVDAEPTCLAKTPCPSYTQGPGRGVHAEDEEAVDLHGLGEQLDVAVHVGAPQVPQDPPRPGWLWCLGTWATNTTGALWVVHISCAGSEMWISPNL